MSHTVETIELSFYLAIYAKLAPDALAVYENCMTIAVTKLEVGSPVCCAA